jgi:hypothetical protein
MSTDQTIEEQINSLQDVAQYQNVVSSPNYQRLVKAFRLKYFMRCPKCDSPSLARWRLSNLHCDIIECNTCDGKITIDDIEAMNLVSNDDYDLLIVDKFNEC